jgi:hypothetical protein
MCAIEYLEERGKKDGENKTKREMRQGRKKKRTYRFIHD